MLVYSDLVVAYLEQLSADPAAGATTGRFYLNTTDHVMKWYANSAWRTAMDLNTSQTASNKTFASPVITTAAMFNAQAELRLGDADSSNYVGFKAPATVGTNKVWTLPNVDGSSGQVLGTNASAVLDWYTVLTNPMDSAGDMIYGGASGVATKLDAGTAGQWLVSGGAAAPVWSGTSAGGKTVYFDGTTGSSNIFNLEVFGSSGNASGTFNLITGRGTRASPTQTQSGDSLCEIVWRGINNTPTGTSAAAAIAVVTTQAFTTTATGTEMRFGTCPNGSTSVANNMILGQDGVLTLGVGFKVPSTGATATTLAFNADVTATIAGSGPFASTNFTFRFTRTHKSVTVSWPQVLVAGNNVSTVLTLDQTNWPSWARPVSVQVNAPVFVRSTGTNQTVCGNLIIPGSGNPTVNFTYATSAFPASNGTTCGMEAGHVTFTVM